MAGRHVGACAGGGLAERVDRGVAAVRAFERLGRRPLAELFDRRDCAEAGHGMLCYNTHDMSSEAPRYRPLERFWPYAELPEQPTERELTSLDPELHDALFGVEQRPFSVTVQFPHLETPDFARALEIARASAEFREIGTGAALRYRARFHSSDAARLRDLFQLVGPADATEVLIDDRPLPYARELWLPLFWFLLHR